MMRLDPRSANTITSAVPHDEPWAPLVSRVVQMLDGTPPSMGTFFISLPTQKPTHLPSGEMK